MAHGARSLGIYVLIVAMAATVCPCAQIFAARSDSAGALAPVQAGHECCHPRRAGPAPSPQPASQQAVCCHANLAGEPAPAGLATHAASRSLVVAAAAATFVVAVASDCRQVLPVAVDASPPRTSVPLFLLTRAILV